MAPSQLRVSLRRTARLRCLGYACLLISGFMSQARAQEVSEIMPLAAESLVLDIAGAGSSHLVAVGQRGHILLSKDSGGSWTQIPAPTRSMLTGVSFADRTHGFAVGHDSVILRTSDGGYSWTLSKVESDFEVIFLDVHMLNPSTAFAIGAYGEYWTTRDGGETWNQDFISEEELHFNTIAQGGDGTLYIAGESGTLLRSDDRGQSWAALDSPYFGSFHGLLPVGSSRILVYGLRGHVFQSRDRGETWTDLTVPAPVLFSGGTVTGYSQIILGGQGGNILISHTRDTAFRMARRSELDKIVQLHALPDGGLLIAGNRGLQRLTAGEIETLEAGAVPVDPPVKE